MCLRKPSPKFLLAIVCSTDRENVVDTRAKVRRRDDFLPLAVFPIDKNFHSDSLEYLLFDCESSRALSTAASLENFFCF